eukprot:scaffold27541_cov56-Phaeocystis_antarctica.AAC.1
MRRPRASTRPDQGQPPGKCRRVPVKLASDSGLVGFGSRSGNPLTSRFRLQASVMFIARLAVATAFRRASMLSRLAPSDGLSGEPGLERPAGSRTGDAGEPAGNSRGAGPVNGSGLERPSAMAKGSVLHPDVSVSVSAKACSTSDSLLGSSGSPAGLLSGLPIPSDAPPRAVRLGRRLAATQKFGFGYGNFDEFRATQGLNTWQASKAKKN